MPDKWTKVIDTYPEIGTKCLVRNPYGERGIGTFNGKGWSFKSYYVTNISEWCLYI